MMVFEHRNTQGVVFEKVPHPLRLERQLEAERMRSLTKDSGTVFEETVAGRIVGIEFVATAQSSRQGDSASFTCLFVATRGSAILRSAR